jgi:hypothetical protein
MTTEQLLVRLFELQASPNHPEIKPLEQAIYRDLGCGVTRYTSTPSLPGWRIIIHPTGTIEFIPN